MQALAEPQATDTPQPVDDTPPEDLTHVWCCDENVAMCGVDITGDRLDDGQPLCPACDFIESAGLPCPVEGCKGG